MIRAIDKYDQYATSTGWYGKITQEGGLQNGQGYKLYLSNQDELTYKGRLLKGEEVTINIQENWNWIGFIGFKAMAINEAMAGFTNATDGDILKSQYAVAVYVDENIGWIGNLTHLHPGEGYMLKATKAGTYTYPNISLAAGERRASLKKGVDAKGLVTESTWELNPHKYNATMTAIIEVEDVQDIHSRIAAIVDGECRGIAYPIMNPITKRYTYFMTIYGEVANDKVAFEFLDGEQGQIYPAKETLKYKSEEIKGTVERPFVLSLDYHAESLNEENQSISLIGHPNPFGNELLLEFNHASEGDMTITITDAAGKVIFVESIANTEYMFTHKINTSDLATGVYLIRVEMENGETLHTRVAKK